MEYGHVFGMIQFSTPVLSVTGMDVIDLAKSLDIAEEDLKLILEQERSF